MAYQRADSADAVAVRLAFAVAIAWTAAMNPTPGKNSTTPTASAVNGRG